MAKHQTIYCRARNPVSLGIRVLDGMGPWSHAAGVLSDGVTAIEARAPYGVVATPLGVLIDRSSEFVIVTREVTDKEAGDEWALSTIGSKYDWAGAFGTPWHRNWQRPGRWFCSEHEATWRAKCRTPAFRSDARGVGPNRSYWAL